jgi:hypothetical protein
VKDQGSQWTMMLEIQEERLVRKYIAARLSVVVAIGLASALDVGLGGKAGGIRVGGSRL